MSIWQSGKVSVSHTGDSGFEYSNLLKIIFFCHWRLTPSFRNTWSAIVPICHWSLLSNIDVIHRPDSLVVITHIVCQTEHIIQWIFILSCCTFIMYSLSLNAYCVVFMSGSRSYQCGLGMVYTFGERASGAKFCAIILKLKLKFNICWQSHVTYFEKVSSFVSHFERQEFWMCGGIEPSVNHGKILIPLDPFFNLISFFFNFFLFL